MTEINYLEEQLVTLDGEDGSSHVCRILGMFEFENKEYVLLLNTSEETEEDAEPSPVVMELLKKDNQTVFRAIESSEEFKRVLAYIRELALEMDVEPEEGDTLSEAEK